MSLKAIADRVLNSLHYRMIYAPKMDMLYRAYQNRRIKQIRKKEKIKVLFIVGELNTWKTEPLYIRMLSHPRFLPVLGISKSLWFSGSKKVMIEYAQLKGYEFIDLDQPGFSIKEINPDIKFYYKPYESSYPRQLFWDHNLKSLLCSINYGFNLSSADPKFRHGIKDYSWKEFIENDCVAQEMTSAGKNVGNKAITGLPIQDFLSKPKERYPDPWKDRSHHKKRIIYAPHHSFKGSNGNFIEYATFLEFGEFMLSMASKYSKETEWVFKPHPALKARLNKAWGKDKADKYYQEWADLPNAQVQLGEYNAIFKHSDAMIHDCSSFIIEYLYTDNPVLFLENEPHTAEQMHVGEFGYEAYKALQHASTEQQIENFIHDIINGNDNGFQARKDYFNKYLSIPNGKSACDNIIDVILGTNE